MQGSLQPIHGAATKGHLNVVRLLIDTYGVDPTVKTDVSAMPSTNSYILYTLYIYVVQNFQGTKLLWLGHHVSICRKIFAFASKQCPQVPKHFEICRKHLQFNHKSHNSFGPRSVLYYTVASNYVCIIL